jgi:hypothetical protein
MSAHNRRLYAASAASAVAIAKMEATPAPDQEAPPQRLPNAATVLENYLFNMWNGVDDTKIADFFDGESWDLDELQRQHEIWRDALGSTPFPVRIVEVLEGLLSAIAYCQMAMADGGRYDAFFRIMIDANGKIVSYQWMAEPE